MTLHKEMIHPHIIRLFNFFESQRHVYLILEYLPNGNLFEFMRGKSIDNALILKIFRQIFSAVDFIHSKKIFHRDIKPENILLDSNHNFKLCDFGFSANFGDGEERQTLCGTKDYLAPEVIASSLQDDKVDIWCMGVLLFELIHKRPPFMGKNIINLLEDIKSMKIKFSPNIKQEFKQIIEWCLKFDPNQRPSARKLIETFPILKEGTGSIRELSNLLSEQSQSQKTDSMYKRNEQQSNVNINIGSVNINIVNTNSSGQDKKNPSENYFNVYSNFPSTQASERTVFTHPTEQNNQKFSTPERIIADDGSSRHNKRVQEETSFDKLKKVLNDGIKGGTKLSYTNTNYTNYSSQTYSYPSNQHINPNIARSVNSMMEHKSDNGRLVMELKPSYSTNNSKREIFDPNESEFAEKNRMRGSPIKKDTFFEIANKNFSSNIQSQTRIKTAEELTKNPFSYSPVPVMRDFAKFGNPNNFVKVTQNPKDEVYEYHNNRTQQHKELIHPKLSLNNLAERVQVSSRHTSPYPQQIQQRVQYVKGGDGSPNGAQLSPHQSPNTQFNWSKAQRIPTQNMQLVNIYKKETNEMPMNHTNIYKNINNEGGTPQDEQTMNKTRYIDNRQTNFNTSNGRQFLNNPGSLMKIELAPQMVSTSRSSNDAFISRTVTYPVQTVDRGHYSSSSVPRRNESNVFELQKLNKQISAPKQQVIMNQEFQITQKPREVRSNSAQLGNMRTVRYINN